MIIGVGAGWHDLEHEMFGFELGDVKTRLDRFEEGVQVMHTLIHSNDPVSYDGKFFHLKDAKLVPQTPVRIMIGGNGVTRTLPLVARYADVWNGQIVNVAEFKAVNQRLDGMIEAAGRDPKAVKRTVMVPVLCWQSEADIDRHVALIQRDASPWRDASSEAIKKWLITDLKGIKGTPQQVMDELGAFARNGAEEIIVEWFALNDFEGIEMLGKEVIARFDQ